MILIHLYRALNSRVVRGVFASVSQSSVCANWRGELKVKQTLQKSDKLRCEVLMKGLLVFKHRMWTWTSERWLLKHSHEGSESWRESCHQSIRRHFYNPLTMDNNHLDIFPWSLLRANQACSGIFQSLLYIIYIYMSCLARSQSVTSHTPDWDDDRGWGKTAGMCEVTQRRETERLEGSLWHYLKTAVSVYWGFREEKLGHKFQIIFK